MPIFNQPKLASGQAGLALLLKTFEVDFLVIGGWAVRAHGYNRQTHDLDILLGQSQENAMRFANALSWAGQPMAPPGWEAVVLTPGIRLAYPNDNQKEADLLTSINGFEFAPAFQQRQEVQFGDLTLAVPDIKDLIRMKELSSVSGNDEVAKKKDVQDIATLKQLHQLL